MTDDIRLTGTYISLVAHDGLSIVEARARSLARKADRALAWGEYLDAAKAQLIAEMEADQVDIAPIVRALEESK